MTALLSQLPTSRTQAAFTLVEMVIDIIVMAQQAMAVGEAYLEEILLKNFEDPVFETGGGRG